MTDTIAAMQQRIDELEAAIESMKAGNIMEALAMQLGIEYNVARCRWVAAGYPRKCFSDALECALIERTNKLPDESTGAKATEEGIGEDGRGKGNVPMIPHNPRPGHP